MKKVIFVFLTVVNIAVYAQSKTEWKEVLLKPDLLVHFPKEPLVTGDTAKQIYTCDAGNIILTITVENNPLNYTGRSVAEVDKEFYDNLTRSILDNNQTLLEERNFKFDGQHVRELVYYDTLDFRPCRVTLQILNVVGWGDAMYKFYLYDFGTTSPDSANYDEFFQNWNLYYSLESKMNNNKRQTDDILEENGFTIEKEEKKKRE